MVQGLSINLTSSEEEIAKASALGVSPLMLKKYKEEVSAFGKPAEEVLLAEAALNSILATGDAVCHSIERSAVLPLLPRLKEMGYKYVAVRESQSDQIWLDEFALYGTCRRYERHYIVPLLTAAREHGLKVVAVGNDLPHSTHSNLSSQMTAYDESVNENVQVLIDSSEAALDGDDIFASRSTKVLLWVGPMTIRPRSPGVCAGKLLNHRYLLSSFVGLMSSSSEREPTNPLVELFDLQSPIAVPMSECEWIRDCEHHPKSDVTLGQWDWVIIYPKS